VDVKEMEANFFAAAILMPRRFLEVDPLVSEFGLEDATAAVKALAGQYRVSQSARRGTRLGNLAIPYQHVCKRATLVEDLAVGRPDLRVTRGHFMSHYINQLSGRRRRRDISVPGRC
jgi:hypothetical protein